MSEQSGSAQSRPVSLTVAEAQRAVDASILALGGYWPPLANLARLFEECGELARSVNQTYGPKQRKPDEAATVLLDELGDVLYVTLGLANSLGLDADAALRSALDKTARRVAPMPPTSADEMATGQRETDL